MIQPCGFHIGVSGDWLVNAVSANIGDFIPATTAGLLGQPLTTFLCANAVHDVRNRMALLRGDDTVEHLPHVALVTGGKPFDLLIYRDGQGFGIDAEPSDGHAFGDATGTVEGMLARLDSATDVASLCAEAASQLRALTGFDQAMICGDGALLGHSARGGLTAADAADIPRWANQLAVVDHHAEPVPVETIAGSGTGQSRTTLRMPDEDETAGLESLGARAALIVPLSRNGAAWGHVACLHGTPRHISAERRSIVRLFARIMALRIELAELRGA